MKMSMLLSIFLLLCNSILAYGQTYNDTNTLITNLLNGYNKNIRPVQYQSDQLTVTVSGHLYNLLEVDTLHGSVVLSMALVSRWTDQKLQWNPADYNNTYSIMFKQSEIWTPPIGLGNPTEILALGNDYERITYMYNGMALWQCGNIIHSACKLNLRHWPFDKQTCEIMYTIQGYSVSQLQMEQMQDQTPTTYMFPNDQWSIEVSAIKTATNFGIRSQVIFEIRLERFSSFYVIAIFLPLIAIGALNSLVFLLPSACGERVGYSITMLLSMTVFLTVIADNLPKVSDPLPLMCVILTLDLILSVLTMLFVILNLSLYHRDNEIEISTWYRFLVYLARIKKQDRRPQTDMNKIFPSNMSMNGMDQKQSEDKTELRSQSEESECDSLNWKLVSCAIDRILFTLFTLANVLPTFVFLIYFPIASEY